MPRCLTYKRRSEIDHNRPSPLTCRHRRHCDCDRGDTSGQCGQGKTEQGSSVSALAPALGKPWESEQARMVLRALDPFPAAKDAVVDAIRRIYQGLK